MRSRSLLTQVLLVNLLLVVTTVAVAVLAGQDAPATGRNREAVVALLGIAGTLLGNWLLLRRRFAPLEEVLSTLERIDLADPDPSALAPPGPTSELRRLDAGVRRLIERLQTERRAAGGAVVAAQERERRRIAQDLHDEVNQALTAVTLRLQASIASAPAELREELGETKELVNLAMRELLALARQLRPAVLDDHGLVPALRTQVREFGRSVGLDARLSVTGEASGLTPELDLAIYRVCQESLSNIARHAGATRAEIELELGTRTSLRVTDDGAGFTPSERAGSGLGLSGMRERALVIGARLDITSAPGRGTTVEFVLD